MRPLHKRMSPYSLIRLLADIEIDWLVHERRSRWQQLTIQTEGGVLLTFALEHCILKIVFVEYAADGGSVYRIA